MVIGRQVKTDHGKFIDLLLIDSLGSITIAELKKHRTSRDVVGQLLDYASWVNKLTFSKIKDIFENYKNLVLETAFEDYFGQSLPEEINSEHYLMVVASYLDHETERIINYLSDIHGVPINAIFFNFFQDGNNEYITRNYLIDPNEVEEKVSRSVKNRKSEPWNGVDFVANVRVENDISAWDDNVRYGFISAGGGSKYSKPLNALYIGARVFAMIPGKGYVGIGEVIGEKMHIEDFHVDMESDKIALLDVRLKAEYIKRVSKDRDLDEYIVPIKWIKFNDESDGFWIKGLRANQNPVFRLKNKFTIDQLSDHFKLNQDDN